MRFCLAYLSGTLQKRRLRQFEDLWQAGLFHQGQAVLLQSGGGGQQVHCQLRNVQVGLAEQRGKLDQDRVQAVGLHNLVVVGH